MKIKIIEAETVVIVEYPYRLNDQIALGGIIGIRFFMDYKRNAEMTYLYKLVEFEQRNDW
jgi:hypothetical protein